MHQLWFLICVSLLFLLPRFTYFILIDNIFRTKFFLHQNVKRVKSHISIYNTYIIMNDKKYYAKLVYLLFIMQIWNVVSYSNTSPLFYPTKITLAKSVHKRKQGSKLPSVICDVSVRWCAMLLCYWEENKKIFVVVVCSSSSNGANLPVARVRLF